MWKGMSCSWTAWPFPCCIEGRYIWSDLRMSATSRRTISVLLYRYTLIAVTRRSPSITLHYLTSQYRSSRSCNNIPEINPPLANTESLAPHLIVFWAETCEIGTSSKSRANEIKENCILPAMPRFRPKGKRVKIDERSWQRDNSKNRAGFADLYEDCVTKRPPH